MAPYIKIVKKRTYLTYAVNNGLFGMVGFEREDIANIGMIHLVSFLGLFSMEMMPDKYRDFVEKFMLTKQDPPDDTDVLSKNQANFTIFLKQRFEEVVRICRQKVRNIRGIPFEEFQPFYGNKRPPMDVETLIEDHESYGFRKMDIAVFKTLRKKAGAHGQNSFRYGKVWYILVPLKYRNLFEHDLSGAGLDPHDNIHNMNPEELLSKFEDSEKWDRKRKSFKSKSKGDRAKIYEDFIEKNKDSQMFAEEVKIAKRALVRMGMWNKEQ
jgi:hypothetical protein